MHRFLEDILSRRRARIRELKGALGEGSLVAASDLSAPADPAPALRRGPGIIVAEIKKASPSRGPIAPDVDVAARAQAYERGGAGAVSVLCEPDFFLGSRQDVRAAAETVSIPVLCKDFILDPLQLRLARQDGASWALLIARVLGPELAFMVREALGEGLEPLVEVHSEEEMGDAVLAGARLIGVNSRDLDTFEVDLGLAKRLASLCPSGCACIAESGIKGPEDIVALKSAGAHGFLIGETLMREADPIPLLREFRRALDLQENGVSR